MTLAPGAGHRSIASRCGTPPQCIVTEHPGKGPSPISLAVVITKPGLATVRLGPFAGDVQAERAAGELRLAAASAAPAGTAVELVAYWRCRPTRPASVS